MTRGEELSINIKAKDDASKVLDKVADKATDLEKPVSVEIDAEVSAALSALDQVAAEAKQTAEAAEMLGRALGPELAAKADPGAVVADLQQMGLSLDQIKGNADELGAKMRELADADVGGKLGSSLGTARGKLDDVTKSADSSKSALANMIGNSAQDLGALSGVAGSAGVALGQMAEYAADAKFSGEGLGSSLKSMVGVAGPIAGLAIATKLVSDAMQAGAKSAKANAEGVERLTQAAEDGTGVIGALGKQIEDTGKLEFRLGGGFDQTGIKVDDLRKNLANLNLNVGDFAALVGRSEGQMDSWITSQRALGAADSDLTNIMIALAAVNDQVATSELDKALNAKIAADAIAEQGPNAEEAIEATARLAEQDAELADAAQAAADALLAQADALNAQVDAALAAADQQLAVNDAMIEFADVLKDGKASTDDVRDSAIDLAKATADLKTEQATAAGVTLTATQRLDNQNGALLATAATAKGPARSAILDYVGSVNQIPPEKMTDIQAAIDRGDIAEAQRLLDEASKTRTAAVKADADTQAAERELNNAARTRDSTIRINAQKGVGWGAAAVGWGALPGGTMAPTATATSVPINVNLGLPTGAEIARRIGRVHLPFSVASSLRADERLSGARDL